MTRRGCTTRNNFAELLESGDEGLREELKRLLAFNRTEIAQLKRIDREVVSILLAHPLLQQRIERLRGIPGVGEITALTWALETGEPSRFPNAKHAISYCGLCAAQRESAGNQKRGPISKQRNPFLQSTLIEAAHMATYYNQTLRGIHAAALQKGHKHRATLEVARRMVRYLLAIDRQYFEQLGAASTESAA